MVDRRNFSHIANEKENFMIEAEIKGNPTLYVLQREIEALKLRLAFQMRENAKLQEALYREQEKAKRRV